MMSISSRILYQVQLLQIRKLCVSTRLSQKTQSEPGVEQEVDGDDEFPVYEIKGRQRPDIPALRPRTPRRIGPRKQGGQPRYLKMKPDQDWTNVWPAATSFKWSAVPFGVRQGYTAPRERSGAQGRPILHQYANPELMKIPNFLHLTPLHARKHCSALRKFCTKWPQQLTAEACDRYFPVVSIKSDYVWSSASVREPKARTATLKVQLSALDLDTHARDKMLRLVGERYDTKTDILTLTADRCPLKQQNYDYCQYLLAVLYKESCKTEPWEGEITADDLTYYDWSLQKSRDVVVDIVRRLMKIKAHENPDLPLSDDFSKLTIESSDEDIINTTTVQHFKDTVTCFHDEGEAKQHLNAYKRAVLELWGLKDVSLKDEEVTVLRDEFKPEPPPQPRVTVMTDVK